MKKTGIIILALSSFGFAIHAGAASFDCSKAKSFSEKTICSDKKLSNDDDELKYLFGRAKASVQDRQAFSEITKSLWNSRERCSDYACVNQWYDSAFEIYGAIAKVGIPVTNGKNDILKDVEELEVNKTKQNDILSNEKRETKKNIDYSLYDSNDRAAPVEHDAVLYSNKEEAFSFIDTLVGFVRKSAYRCDSVSAFRPLLTSNGYYLVCNKFSYKYNIKDNGGNISVEVDN